MCVINDEEVFPGATLITKQFISAWPSPDMDASRISLEPGDILIYMDDAIFDNDAGLTEMIVLHATKGLLWIKAYTAKNGLEVIK